MNQANDMIYAKPTFMLRMLVKKNAVTEQDVTKFAFENGIGFVEAGRYLENEEGPILQQLFIKPDSSSVWVDVKTVIEPNPRG